MTTTGSNYKAPPAIPEAEIAAGFRALADFIESPAAPVEKYPHLEREFIVSTASELDLRSFAAINAVPVQEHRGHLSADVLFNGVVKLHVYFIGDAS
ncbi:hypothetical protein [Glaciihabitans sp. UYNi722]|uniref:hypothetical protein n=1 Tax=Glaciihabitans sp. UYNi722 TaxID=3156344 RepID=UPI003399C214